MEFGVAKLEKVGFSRLVQVPIRSEGEPSGAIRSEGSKRKRNGASVVLGMGG